LQKKKSSHFAERIIADDDS